MLAWARRNRADSFSREVVACGESSGDGPYCVAETVTIQCSRVRTLRHSSEASAAYGRVQRWSKVLRLIGTDLALGDKFARKRLCSPSHVSKGDVVLCMRSPRRLIQWYLSGLRAEDNEKCPRTYGLCLQARLPGLTSMEGSLRSPRRDESQAPGYRWDRSQRMTDWLSFAQWCVGALFCAAQAVRKSRALSSEC